jgi:addiction module RelB/DinJ family antitoxin
MKIKTKTQIQVRIDADTKKKAKEVLENIGMDASTVVNILFKQIARFGTLPIDLRDLNGFTSSKANELKESVHSALRSKKTFKNAKSLMRDLSA